MRKAKRKISSSKHSAGENTGYYRYFEKIPVHKLAFYIFALHTNVSYIY
jgi:hypothetical protein